MPDRSPNDPRCRYEEIHKILAKIIELVKPETDLTDLEPVIDAWYARNSLCKRTTNKDRCQAAWVLYYNRVQEFNQKPPKSSRRNMLDKIDHARTTLENPEELV